MDINYIDDEILLSVEKPARYIGQELNMVKKSLENIDIRFCMCFPDVYEVGMSHLGIQILYDMLNRRNDTYCERVYSPWNDMDRLMREKNIPLYALETKTPVKHFDFLGITLQYEMCYTNVLQILDLSGIPIYASDRTDDDPIVIGGGPCVYNPEPIADFFDIFYIGEGETVYNEMLDRYKELKHSGASRRECLRQLANIEGLYIPSLYNIEYNDDFTIKEIIPADDKVPMKIKRQVVSDIDNTYYPDKPLVPYIQAVQDRVVLEIQRGCIRGCRFCQAGMIYRPVRERSLEFLKNCADKMLASTGYDEITLSSLSSSDYSNLKELVYYLIDNYSSKGVNISLPSLRIDSFALDVMGKVQDVKRSSLTFAPEAGTQRLRNIINKGLSESDILEGAGSAFNLGWNKVKLYFMLGLPFEQEEDVEGIPILADKIARRYYEIPKEERNGKVAITISTSFFVPKPFTAFQWAPMITKEEYLRRKALLQDTLRNQLNNRSIKYNWHDGKTSELEALFARGDRRLSGLIYSAYKKGCMFDAWSEFFDYGKWQEAMAEQEIDLGFYIYRERSRDEILPWDFIDSGISKKYLWHEYENAKAETVTPNCMLKCSGCGAAAFDCGICKTH